jgi:hypothetical protein
MNIVYGKVMHACVRIEAGNSYYRYGDFGWPSSPPFRSLEVLERERLLDINRVVRPDIRVEAGYFNLTLLGISFVRDCSPDAPLIATRRANAASEEPKRP